LEDPFAFKEVKASSNRKDRLYVSSGSKNVDKQKEPDRRNYDSFYKNQVGVLNFLDDEDETDGEGTDIRRTEEDLDQIN